MSDYRLYLLDHQGRIVRAVEIACTGDAEALEQSARLAQGGPAELWERARKVGEIAAVGEPQA